MTSRRHVTLQGLISELGPSLGLLGALAPPRADGAAVAGAGGAAAAVVVTDVVCDSRQARPGALFVALRGGRTDGMAFAAQAVARGAVAVVADATAADVELNVPLLRVAAPRRAVGLLAAAVHGHPTRALAVVGVTGTNGKSTTAIFVAQLATAAGVRACALGTLGLWTPEGVRPGGLTTPDGADLQRTFAALRDEGFALVAIEASSHALDQERLVGTGLQAIAFTNLTVDHLDYHGTLERYAAAKQRLFHDFDIDAARSFAHVDDPAGAALVEAGRARGFSLRAHPLADVRATAVRSGRDGIALHLCRPGRAPLALRAPVVGRHNAENLVTAALLAAACGVDDDALRRGAATLQAPAGRLQPVANDLGALVLVDYAHTPDALARVLATARDLCGPGGRLICVFGAGGDRDRSKRPQMGEAAALAADLLVVTSDNPRSEPPAAIVEEICAGALAAGARRIEALLPSTLGAQTATAVAPAAGSPARPAPLLLAEVDRDNAIRRAVGVLAAGDVLIVAGKGHEVTQTIGDQVLPFADAERLAYWLRQRRRPAGQAPSKGPPAAAFAASAPAAAGSPGADAGAPRFDGAAAAAATGGRLLVAGPQTAIGVGSDSRAVAAGALFVALRGERFDGHDFVAGALQAGAAGVLVEHGRGAAFVDLAAAQGAYVVEVADALVALGDLAAAFCRALPAIVLGVTGSNGKTSTKELTALALAPFGVVHATFANHNNRIGVPQTLFALRAEHAFAVVEMGMNEPGEIAELSRIARPRLGLITSVGEAHLERLGSLAAVAAEKAALLAALPDDGVALVPHGVEALAPHLAALRGRGVRLCTFGASRGADVGLRGAVTVDGHGQRFAADVFGRAVAVELPALGSHMVDNALGALAVAAVLGDDPQAAAWQLARYQPVGQRMRPLQLGALLVLEDCYNANPSSVEAALRTLAELPRPRVAVLGEMRELGEGAVALHRRVAAACAGRAEALIALGAYAPVMAAAAQAHGVVAQAFDGDAIDQAAAAARQAVASAAAGLGGAAARVGLAGSGMPGTILVKGSRGARLERVVAALQRDHRDAEVT